MRRAVPALPLERLARVQGSDGSGSAGPSRSAPSGSARSASGSDRGAQSSRPSSWILRVIVLRPMPSFCAASMRRPRVSASAVRISWPSNWRLSCSQTSGEPASSSVRAANSRPPSQRAAAGHAGQVRRGQRRCRRRAVARPARTRRQAFARLRRRRVAGRRPLRTRCAAPSARAAGPCPRSPAPAPSRSASGRCSRAGARCRGSRSRFMRLERRRR